MLSVGRRNAVDSGGAWVCGYSEIQEAVQPQRYQTAVKTLGNGDASIPLAWGPKILGVNLVLILQ